MDIPLDDQIDWVKREIAMRERANPRFIKEGRHTEESAAKEIATMKAVLATLLAQPVP